MKKSEVLDQLTGTEIAIIGMNCRLPGARNIDEYWQNLANGVESIQFFSDEELKAAGVEPAVLRHPHLVKAGTTIADIDKFDPAFFGMTPREAEIMDPQHRLFLEAAWESLESAGHDPETYKGRIGVYGGVFMSTYVFNLYSNPRLFETVGEIAIRHGNEKDYLATRTSYKMNLKGPSVTLQTSCSTSLVAVHIACQNLLGGECDMALAGGVSIKIPQTTGYFYTEGSILSPDGHVRPFDAKAKGTVFGEGLAMVVLKRLEDAINDGDHVYAVIKGSAINNDGADKVGYTAPSVNGQADVVADALALADVYPETVSYIETHGTGTEMGDPIEISALSQVFRANTDDKQFCAIGSVKSNIGHLGAASGAAGLIKTALALKHGQIPPSLNFDEPNPNIDFENSPFFVNTELREWTSADGEPRRAGVSSFGMGGTNAHVVLEEAPQIDDEAPSKPYELLVLSAKTETAADNALTNLANHLEANPEINLSDVSFTLQAGRRAFRHKRFVVAQNVQDAIEALRDSKRIGSQVTKLGDRTATFLFPGQGSQYVNMGLELYQTEEVFRKHVDACSEKLKAHLGFDLRTALYPAAGQEAEATEKLKQTYITQPALFVIEYATAQLWLSYGIQPEAMIGHSIGEYVAACIAGVFTLDDGLRLIALRGRLMQDLPSGSMLAVPLAEEAVQQYLNDEISLATINAPATCVLAGTHDAIEALEKRLQAVGIDSRRLHTSHAFHSAMMDPILDTFTAEVKKVRLSEPSIRYLSNVTGTWITPQQATDPSYYAKHLRNAVRFAAGVQELLKDTNRVLIEVGPGQALTTVIKRTEGLADAPVIATMRHPQDKQSDVRCLLTAIGHVFAHGLTPNWSDFHGKERKRLPLPTYAFDRKRYWIDAQKNASGSLDVATIGAYATELADWFYIPSWKRTAAPHVMIDSDANVVLLTDSTGIGTKLATRLREQGVSVTTEFTGKNAKIVLFKKDDALQSLTDLSAVIGAQELDSLELLVVAHGTQAVSGEEALNPETAQVLGFARTLAHDHDITVRTIDVVIPAEGTWREDQLLAQLVAEVTASSADRTVAYRGPHRLVQSFEQARLEEQGSSLKQGGVYLLTGGFEGHSLAVAEQIAKTVQAKLVLLAQPGHDTALAAQKAHHLESLGAEVFIHGVDLANAEQMRFALNEINDRFGALSGVIHNAAAGKQDGARVLESLLEGTALDFFLLYSSVRSFRGGEEAAAYNFLDLLAHDNHARRGVNTIAINWGDKAKITAQEEAEAVLRILAHPMPQVIVASQGLSSELEVPKKQKETAQTEEDGAAPLPLKDAPRNEVEHVIAGIWSEIFGIQQVGIHDNFFELGGNSLLAVQFTSRVRNVFQIELNFERLFDEPTVAGLAKLVMESQNETQAEAAASTDDDLEALLLELEGDDVDLDDLLNELSKDLD